MTGTGKLGKSYGKYGSNPDRIKTIRLTEEQEMGWDPDLIRSVLEGSHKSNDSIKINTLKGYLKGLYELLEFNFEIKKDYTSEELEMLLKIEEIVGK